MRFAVRALCLVSFALGVVTLLYGAYLLGTGGADPDGARGPVGALAALAGALVAGYAALALRMTRP